MLACPQCGTMLKIVAPRGTAQSANEASLAPAAQLPQDLKDTDQVLSSPDSVPVIKTKLSSGDYNEIEALLKAAEERGTEPKSNVAARESPNRPPQKSAGQRFAGQGPPVRGTDSKSPSAAASASVRTAGGSQSTASALKNAHGHGQADSIAPPAPTEWMDATTRKRKQMLMLLAASIGVIAVLAAIAFSLFSGDRERRNLAQQHSAGVRQDQPDPDRQAIQPNDGEQDEPVLNDQASGNQESEDTWLNPLQAEPLNSNDGMASNETADHSATNGDATSPDRHDADSEINDLPNTEQEANPDAPNTNLDTPAPRIPNPESRTPNPESPNPESPNLPNFPDASNGASSLDEKELANSVTSLDRLSQFIESSPLSISKLKAIVASDRMNQRVGVPKYRIDRTSDFKLDTARQLAASCDSIQYDQMKLSIVLNDLIAITGIPFTIDVRALEAIHSNPNPLVSIEATATTWGAAIDQLLASASLSSTTTDLGILVSAGNQSELTEVVYELPAVDSKEPSVLPGSETGANEAGANEAGADEAGANETPAEDPAKLDWPILIQTMIAPASWSGETGDPARISVMDGQSAPDRQSATGRQSASDRQLVVSNTPTVHHEIGSLIRKYNAAVALAGNPEELSANEALKPRFRMLEDKLKLPSGIEHRFSEPLLELMTGLSANTGVTVLADWESLIQEGLTPQTSIPGTLIGETLGDLLNELAQALEITYVVIDPETLLLTTFEAAHRQRELEVYSLNAVLDRKVNIDQLHALLRNVLGSEIDRSMTQIYFDRESQSLIVVGPQSIHRHLGAVLKAIAE